MISENTRGTRLELCINVALLVRTELTFIDRLYDEEMRKFFLMQVFLFTTVSIDSVSHLCYFVNGYNNLYLLHPKKLHRGYRPY